MPEYINVAKGQAGDWVGILFAAYSLFAVFAASVMAPLADRLGRKAVYAAALVIGGLSYLSFGFIPSGESITVNLLITSVVLPRVQWLLIPMIGIGIAWAAMLAMPYAILAGSRRRKKRVSTWEYSIHDSSPQIVSGLLAGWLVTEWFDNQVVHIIYVAGLAMVAAGLAVFRVKDNASISEAETVAG